MRTLEKKCTLVLHNARLLYTTPNRKFHSDERPIQNPSLERQGTTRRVHRRPALLKTRRVHCTKARARAQLGGNSRRGAFVYSGKESILLAFDYIHGERRACHIPSIKLRARSRHSLSRAIPLRVYDVSRGPGHTSAFAFASFDMRLPFTRPRMRSEAAVVSRLFPVSFFVFFVFFFFFFVAYCWNGNVRAIPKYCKCLKGTRHSRIVYSVVTELS